ncbi:hypothetical protein ACN20G_25090 [Streptomyces sp. BI20]|uniref:hypothetical protein n=1 Tax=Streptomyces sp. BI20 TaxID=3403460 RepID=UPI003C73E071
MPYDRERDAARDNTRAADPHTPYPHAQPPHAQPPHAQPPQDRRSEPQTAPHTDRPRPGPRPGTREPRPDGPRPEGVRPDGSRPAPRSATAAPPAPVHPPTPGPNRLDSIPPQQSRRAAEAALHHPAPTAPEQAPADPYREPPRHTPDASAGPGHEAPGVGVTEAGSRHGVVEGEPHGPAPLLDEGDARNFRGSWHEIQGRFVDDPQEAVRAADALVGEVVRALTGSFAQHKRILEAEWHEQAPGEDPATEELRLALRSYRSFFDRLLHT